MRDLYDTEIARLQQWLDTLPAADQDNEADAPLDVSALDGYLCGVLLQPQPVPEHRWWPYAQARADADKRGTAAGAAPPLQDLVRRRHAALAQAINARRWFDPWIFELEPQAQVDAAAREADQPEHEVPAAVRDSVLPWVAGFALAVERFPALLRLDERALAEPLALLYQHFAAGDLDGLDDEPALAAALAEVEPPADMSEAAEDLVRAVLLLADVGRPLKQPPRRTTPGRASPGPGRRSKSARRARTRPG